MTVFGWLFLGHFVADWLLQSDWMALGKRGGLLTKPGLAHYAVYTIVIIWPIFAFATPACAALPSLSAVAVIVFLSHWVIDGADLAHQWMRCFGQRDQVMVALNKHSCHQPPLLRLTRILIMAE